MKHQKKKRKKEYVMTRITKAEVPSIHPSIRPSVRLSIKKRRKAGVGKEERGEQGFMPSP
jgi:hypothetical protein